MKTGPSIWFTIRRGKQATETGSILKKIFFFLLLTLTTPTAFSQSTDSLPTQDSSMRIIEIIRADNWRQITTDSGKILQTLTGQAMVKHENTILSGDSIICDLDSGIAEVFGNIQINDGDTVQTNAGYLKYFGKEKRAILKNNVVLTDKKGIIYSNNVLYDVGSGIATYSGGGKVVNGSTTLTSTDAVYYSNTKDVYFKKNVRLKDPKYSIISDSLMYNTDFQTATFIAPTKITGKDKSIIETSSGNYNLKNGQAIFYDRTSYRDSARSIIGNNIAYDEKNSTIQVEGNGKVVDSANKVIVIGNQILINKKNQTFLGTRKPVMIFYSDKDSTYISADTLFSGLLEKEPDSTQKKQAAAKNKKKGEAPVITYDSIRYFLAFHHVRVFNDSLQASSDSLYYSTKDSTLRLYYSPVFWSGHSQGNGDTIYMHLANKKPEHLEMIDNAMLINRTTEGLFNQAAGRTINAFFKDGNLDYARIKGSPAESIYYPQDDDSAYIGLNRSTGDVIDILFENKELTKVKFINDVNGTLYPLGQITDTIKFLKDFKWQEERRPKTKLELFE